jgi:ATP-dependent DNA ligase
VSIAKGKVAFIEPMLALAVTKLPEGPAWAYELKFDGYRAKRSDSTRFAQRYRLCHPRFASIANALEALPDDTVIYCEIIASTTRDTLRSNVLPSYRSTGPEIHLYVFDLLTLHGKDARHAECARHHRGPAELSRSDSRTGGTIASSCVDDMSAASVGLARCA